MSNFKNKIYRLRKKKILNINNYDKIHIFYLIKSMYRGNNGNINFKIKNINLLYLNKSFFNFTITKQPKPYPFKIIKN